MAIPYPSPFLQQLKPRLWSGISTDTSLGQGTSLIGQGFSASLLPPTVYPPHNSQSLSETNPKESSLHRSSRDLTSQIE